LAGRKNTGLGTDESWALRSVVTEGETVDEALANAREAIELALEVLAERGA
jgi:predicted RNase H-like HicB family nuclease